jgi:sec-independent protein translocase protein TatB
MFDIAPSELMIVAFVAIVLIGPKDLPRVMRVVGNWVGKGRTMMKHMRGAVDDMMRQAEVQELARKSKAEEDAQTSLLESISASEHQQPPAPAFARAEEPVLAMAQGNVR